MKFTILAALPLIAIGAPALAQTAAPAPANAPAPAAQTAPQAAPATATPTVGAKVYGSAGTEIGTVEAVTAQAVTINTGTARIALPPASIGTGPKGLAIALTKEQLEAQAASAAANAASDLKSKLVPGAAVAARDGTTPLGTVKTADAQYVTLTTPKGDVRLPVGGFGLGPNGIILGMTANEFNAAVGGAATPR